MKKSLIMGAMLLLAAASYAADKVYDLSKPTAWAGKHTQAGKDGGLSIKNTVLFVSNVMIPVDGKHTYTFSGSAFAPAGKIAGHTLTGYYLYDKNKKFISQFNADKLVKSDSELAEAAKKGSKTIKIKANNQWKAYGFYWVGFNVKKGKVCRDLSPGTIREVKKEGDTMTIAFRNPLSKDYPAGTKVAIFKSGSYFYSSTFPTRNNVNNFSKTFKQSNFWVETAYIKPIILVNWMLKKGTDKSKVETVFKNMKVTVKEIK